MSVTINVPINTLTYSGVNVVNTIICTFIFEIMVVLTNWNNRSFRE